MGPFRHFPLTLVFWNFTMACLRPGFFIYCSGLLFGDSRPLALVNFLVFFFQLQYTFTIILYQFQMYREVVRKSCTLQGGPWCLKSPPPIHSCHDSVESNSYAVIYTSDYSVTTTLSCLYPHLFLPALLPAPLTTVSMSSVWVCSDFILSDSCITTQLSSLSFMKSPLRHVINLPKLSKSLIFLVLSSIVFLLYFYFLSGGFSHFYLITKGQKTASGSIFGLMSLWPHRPSLCCCGTDEVTDSM